MSTQSEEEHSTCVDGNSIWISFENSTTFRRVKISGDSPPSRTQLSQLAIQQLRGSCLVLIDGISSSRNDSNGDAGDSSVYYETEETASACSLPSHHHSRNENKDPEDSYNSSQDVHMGDLLDHAEANLIDNH